MVARVCPRQTAWAMTDMRASEGVGQVRSVALRVAWVAKACTAGGRGSWRM